MPETKKILIISSCSSKKLYNPDNKLVAKDKLDDAFFSQRVDSLDAYKVPAYNMYIGRQYGPYANGELGPLKKAVESLRKKYGKNVVDLFIVSAGYGLISEDKEIVPYDISFNDIRKATDKKHNVDSWSDFLKIHCSIVSLVKNYDIIFVLLADKYTDAIQLPIDIGKRQKVFYFDKRAKLSCMSNKDNFFIFDINNRILNSFGGGYKARAVIFMHLCNYLIKNFAENPFDIFDDINDEREFSKLMIASINMMT
jgi:arabinogalactan endo-1,4-beta-galactosidase